MATITDWSKFQRRQLHTLLAIQAEVGKGNVASVEQAVVALIAEMEDDDIQSVKNAVEKAKLI